MSKINGIKELQHRNGLMEGIAQVDVKHGLLITIIEFLFYDYKNTNEVHYVLDATVPVHNFLI